MPKMFFSKNFMTTAGAILVTGAMLNLANRGVFGGAVKNAANYVTRGYGAGEL